VGYRGQLSELAIHLALKSGGAGADYQIVLDYRRIGAVTTGKYPLSCS
jgi:hypothetical protein